MYIDIYRSILYVKKKALNKNDPRNSILQHRRVVDKNCCVVFLTSDFNI